MSATCQSSTAAVVLDQYGSRAFANIEMACQGLHISHSRSDSMPKLTLSIILATMFASGAFAQTSGPGQDKAVQSAPATAAEKAEAKAARKQEGSIAAKTAPRAEGDPSSLGTARSTTKAERKAAKTKRKAAGAKAAKEPKETSGPNG
jgi:hypothetical protein